MKKQTDQKEVYNKMDYAPIRAQIKEHYDKNETELVIERTVWIFKMSLKLGYNTLELYQRTNDLGVKPTEMGISLALSLKQTEDSFLSEKDRELKKVFMKKFAEPIKVWEEGMEN